MQAVILYCFGPPHITISNTSYAVYAQPEKTVGWVRQCRGPCSNYSQSEHNYSQSFVFKCPGTRYSGIQPLGRDILCSEWPRVQNLGALGTRSTGFREIPSSFEIESISHGLTRFFSDCALIFFGRSYVS